MSGVVEDIRQRAGPLHDLLEEALQVPNATFTVYRDRLLVGFSTDELMAGRRDQPLLHRVEHMGYVSWRLGDPFGHACYLDPGAITGVHFAAERFDCMNGRMNLIIWFLVDFETGCPAGSDAYASITLEDPGEGGAAMERFEAVLELYRRHRQRAGVTADAAFHNLAEGPAAA